MAIFPVGILSIIHATPSRASTVIHLSALAVSAAPRAYP